jgi:formamidopyrimidine-DNA glycosylase
VLRYVDPRRFGMLDIVAGYELGGHTWLAHLGLEPLANSFDGAALLQALGRSRSPVKVALMDQRIVVGVGNIYASEALHRAGISPRRLAANLGRARADRLALGIREVLLAAIDAGGSSLRDYVQSNGELGNFQSNFRVYDRSGLPCLTCGQAIQRIVQGSRASYFCLRCQR